MTTVTPWSAELLAKKFEALWAAYKKHWMVKDTKAFEEFCFSNSDEISAALRLAAKPADPDAMNEERALEDAQLASNVREATIEECAKACDTIEKAAEIRANGLQSQSPGQEAAYDKAAAANTCARAIRALSTTGKPKPKTPMPWIDAEEGDMS